jgi:hypothetical protein
MQLRFLLLLTAVWLTWGGGSPAAQAPGRTGGAATRGPKAASCVSLLRQRDGDRALVISYPWDLHRRPSVEVRLVTGKDPGPTVVRPLLFVGNYMKGKVAAAVYRCEDKAVGAPVRESLTVKGLQFEILGRRNRLERPSVCVIHRFADDQPAPGTTAVFSQLPAWAINRRLLQLDLPREEFTQPGRLYVWFLRDETVLWEETVDWPGYAKRGPSASAESPKAAAP